MFTVPSIPDHWAGSDPARRRARPQGGGSGGRWPFPVCCGQGGHCRRCGHRIPASGHNSPAGVRCRLRPGCSPVFGKDLGDLQQLHGGVVRELDPVGKTGGKAAVGGEEGLHLPGVTRQNDHQLIPVILHPLHQRVDGFQPEAVLLTAIEAVCLVNEKHTTQRALDDAVGGGAVWPV